MTNNDVLRSFRHALELTPAELAVYFAEGGASMPLSRVAALLKDDGEQGFEALPDEVFARFLAGLIAAHRGRRDDPAEQQPEELTNNRIMRAFRIAFALRDTDILAFMHAAGRDVGKTELGALFRHEDHRNYQPCGDQFLRSFMRGLGMWHRQGRKTIGSDDTIKRR